jgi:hypothetical protein
MVTSGADQLKFNDISTSYEFQQDWRRLISLKWSDFVGLNSLVVSTFPSTAVKGTL